MSLRTQFISGLIAGLPLLAQTSPPLSTVSSVRHWSLETSTRVAIQASEETRFHVEVLQNPDRLFVDLLDSSLKIDGKRAFKLEIDDALVTQIRGAQTQPKVARVVLDLKVAVDYEISHLANPHRLMIEVRAKSAPGAMPSATAANVPAVMPAAAAVAPVVPEPARPAPVETKTAPVETKAAPVVAPDTVPVPKAARRNSDGSRSMTRALGLKLGRVVIDPGHGGKDEGTSGAGGLKEKELVLDVALRLGTLLEERMGTAVTYTRKDDIFIPLEERTAIANRNKADLFLSIHANSGVRSAGGVETYFLNFTTSRADLEVAARENSGATSSIYELQDLVRKIALKDKIDESREFATKIQGTLHATWTKSGGTSRNRGVKKAPFVVLIGASMPSVLTEIGFLTNPREQSLLLNGEYRQKIAESLYRGISQYVATLSHFEIAQRQ